MKIKLTTILLLLVSLSTFSQNYIKGKIIGDDGTPLIGVEIKINNSIEASSDFTGEFNIPYQGSYPVDVTFSYIEYITLTKTLFEPANGINLLVQMNKEKITDLTQVVVAASRSTEKKIETPVTIETFSEKSIINGTSPNFYDELVNVKEVQLNSNNLVSKTINTRGFAQGTNTRFLQIADGAEFTIPVFNASIGNSLGVNQLDVDNIEILPGASSALYGANAFNGIMFINSKSPFEKPGISVYYTHGYTSQEAAGVNDFNDFGLRWAYKMTDKVALKLNISYIEGSDWIANDKNSKNIVDIGLPPVQYFDAVNIYGDEITGNSAAAGGPVSRTGYNDADLNDGKIENFNGDLSFHIKPTLDSEIKIQQKISYGTTNFSGTNTRATLKNFLVLQTGLSYTSSNLTFRAYYTVDDAGDSYDMVRTAINVSKSAKNNNEWFTDYDNALSTFRNDNPTFDNNTLLTMAREFADYSTVEGYNGNLPNSIGGQPRFDPGTAAFNNAFNTVTTSNDLTNGSRFQDNSYTLQSDINYNFQDIIKFAEFQLGGTFKKYGLNSKGTVFNDANGKIDYDVYGVYGQLQKKLLDDRLKLTGSVRYDKLTDLEGSFSPRLSVNYALGKRKTRNLRASFQTGFRNPTSSDLYNGANYGFIALVGSAKDNLENYSQVINFTNPILGPDQQTVDITGDYIYGSSFSVGSVQKFANTFSSSNPQPAIDLLEIKKVEAVKAEKVESFELGYRAGIGRFTFDLNGYYNKYTDFIYTKKVVTPYFMDASIAPEYGGIGAAILSQQFLVHQVYTNAEVPIETIGLGFGVERDFKTFFVSGAYNYTKLLDYDQTIDPDFVPEFNTPEHAAKLTFGSEKLFSNFGFNTNLRWNSEYEWVSPFAFGTIPERVVFDAQISYRIPAIKSMVKASANNLFGEEYIQVIGAGNIGQTYFLSLTYNP
ncbi:TonB-dependent receptor [Tamlana sp. s12]|uniref:TonB-dependent receptor domain-containing protein n=1 Tax=Tamlana sp. s12 TaxID=1630406 RepID=UPI0009EDCB51|nr:TonB-dependent receptor [Tamlana sp. s12]QQY82620.1 TonB-dependent receptor [Tamlana sp. s12]